MPTIVAICPYCRIGGVRAPDTAVGASATCPQCKSSFTVMPSDGLPGWAKAPELASAPAARNEPLPVSSPLEETQASAAIPDVTEPSPVLPSEPKTRKKAKSKTKKQSEPEPPAEPKPVPAPTPATAPAPLTTPAAGAEPPPGHDLGLIFALVAVILVGPAVLASQLPYGRAIGLLIAILGFAGGFLSLGAEGRARLAGIAAMVMHFLIAIVLLFLPGWLNLDPWSGGPPPEEPKRPVAVEHGTGTPLPLVPGEPIDAGKASWEFQDVRVTLRSATVSPVELVGPNNAKRTTKEPYLHLILQVTNIGVEREIPLSGWASEKPEGIGVLDANGKQLAFATFEPEWAPVRGRQTTRAMPGHPAEVRLVFTAPPPKTSFVHVQLSGSAFGMTEEIKFRATLTVLVPRSPGK